MLRSSPRCCYLLREGAELPKARSQRLQLVALEALSGVEQGIDDGSWYLKIRSFVPALSWQKLSHNIEKVERSTAELWLAVASKALTRFAKRDSDPLTE